MQGRQGGDGWRNGANQRLAGARARSALPWVSLRQLSLAHNRIPELDPTCLRLVPALEELSLAHNSVASLAAWLEDGACMSSLHTLDLSHNSLQRLFLADSDALFARRLCLCVGLTLTLGVAAVPKRRAFRR
jgi:hypothetical protein